MWSTTTHQIIIFIGMSARTSQIQQKGLEHVMGQATMNSSWCCLRKLSSTWQCLLHPCSPHNHRCQRNRFIELIFQNIRMTCAGLGTVLDLIWALAAIVTNPRIHGLTFGLALIHRSIFWLKQGPMQSSRLVLPFPIVAHMLNYHHNDQSMTTIKFLVAIFSLYNAGFCGWIFGLTTKSFAQVTYRNRLSHLFALFKSIIVPNS